MTERWKEREGDREREGESNEMCICSSGGSLNFCVLNINSHVDGIWRWVIKIKIKRHPFGPEMGPMALLKERYKIMVLNVSHQVAASALV